MKIGIDVSQLVYEDSGVGNYLSSFIQSLLRIDRENEYVLFFSSMRKKIQNSKFNPSASLRARIQNYSPRCAGEADNSKLRIKEFKFPPTILDFLWNKLHIVPIEWLIGDVDVFITSDWTEPPTKKAKKATILYDLIVYKYPKETDKKIVETQKRKLEWVKKESDMVFCISEATKKDAMEILGIEESKLSILYPGVSM